MPFSMKGKYSHLRVMIVEDSPPMQQILSNVVRNEPGLELVSIVESSADFMDVFERQRPQLVILDLALRTGNGIELISQIKTFEPGCRILVFTAYDAEQYRLRCIEIGADWFFSKNRQHREMVDSLKGMGAEARANGNDGPNDQKT